MRRSPPLLFALLLATAGVLAPVAYGPAAGAQQTPEPGVVSRNGSANYAAIPASQVQAAGYVDVGLGVSVAFGGDTHSVRSDYLVSRYERSFTRAETRSNRTAAVRETVAALERRAAALQRRDRTVRRGYANGTFTAEQFARQRAQIQAAATAYERVRTQVARQAENTNGYSIPGRLIVRLANLEAEFTSLCGPASEYVDAAAAGQRPPETVYAESSTTGYTVAYVHEGTYVRETYLGTNRRPNATDQFAGSGGAGLSAAYDRGRTLYPWATNNSLLSPQIQGPLGTSGVYRFSVDFRGGELVAYIDGGTTDVYREAQYRSVTAINGTETTTAESPSLVLTVNRTYETGPMQVRLSQAGTAVPLNGTVSVDGHTVGQTGSDGVLWTVEPRGPATVNVTTAGASVEARI